MNDKEKAEIKKKIEKEIKDCREGIVRLKRSSKPIAPDNAVGRLSRMGSIVDKGVNDAMIEQNEHKLAKLEESLKNIDRPGFGKCELCGCDIPVGRLMAIPECTLCVKCAS